ncbi:MAG: hypothetical protein AAF532_06805 [Planctomycetota bacterium]
MSRFAMLFAALAGAVLVGAVASGPSAVAGDARYGLGLYPPRPSAYAARYRPDPYRFDPYRRSPYGINPYDLTELYASGYRPYRPGPYGFAGYRARSGRNDGFKPDTYWPGYAPRDAVLRRAVPSYSDSFRPDPYRPRYTITRVPYGASSLYRLPSHPGCVGGCYVPPGCACDGVPPAPAPGGPAYLRF